ncbi:Uncharacterised protein [Burkholderia pseudomallei]|nr:hypothetical protein [Burkholderia pseudomallei]CAJ7338981.1 Uncharacterised protein [Burkholderia pseudomallei]CAJ7904007.1 Uncharacterised protein [Burkholderia pseudomallei]CAJ9606305.1 Uncharacterised protein [Burkholderia pseudomallei]
MELKRLISALSVVLPAIPALAVNAYADEKSFPLHAGELVMLQSRPGITQPIYIETETQTPKWVVIDYAGNSGDLHLGKDGPHHFKGNFTIRTASYWLQQGDATVMVDTPSDYADGADDSYRQSKDALKDTEAIVSEVHKRFPGAKVALFSTSRGTISVANFVNREPGLADAFILTSPVSGMSRKVGGRAKISVDHAEQHRVLYVGNKGDVCRATPYYGSKELADGGNFSFITEESHEGGGDPHSDCGGHSPHGYLGIESQVMNDIYAWLTE